MTPTRSEVKNAILGSYSTNPPGIIDRATDAVMALLSTEPTTVLWEGETRMIMHTDPGENGRDSFVHLPPEGFKVPPGTRVRLTAFNDSNPLPQEDPQ